jgi:putative ABC transport system permease protein
MWALVAIVGGTLVFLLAAAPRIGNRIQDVALRRSLAESPYAARDLLLSGPVRAGPAPDTQRLLDDARRSLPEPLRAAVGAQWGAERTGLVVLDGPGVSRAPGGLPPKVTLMHHTGLAAGVPLLDGALPHNGSGAPQIGVMVSGPVAAALGLRTGERYTLRSYFGEPLPIRVTGLFTLPDAGSAAWAPYPTLNRTGVVVEGPAGNPLERATATFVTDEAGMSALEPDPTAWGLVDDLRYRVDEARVDAGDVGPLRAAVTRARTGRPFEGLALSTGLDRVLADFDRQATAVRALLAVVVAGIAGTALGLLASSARFAVRRRSAELSLLRARGASLARLVARLAAESALVVLPATVLGWLAASAVPGRVPDAGWPPVAAALLALVAVPLSGTAVQRPRLRPAPVRRTAEVTLAVLAAAGVVLVRRRGLATAGVDPYLTAVPVLAGTAVGLLALRAYPWPVRALGRLGARRKGGVAFLGLAWAGRSPAGSALPLAVLVLAVGVGGFAGSVRSGVSAARDIAAARLVGGDMRLAAPAFTAGAADRVARVPGVTAVASAYLAAPSSLRTAGEVPGATDVAVVVLDVAAYRRVLRATGQDPRLPADLSTARPDGPVPAVVSPRLSRASHLSVGIDGPARPLRVAGTLDALPGLSRTDFVVVPREAFGSTRSSLLFVAGRHADPAAVRAAATVPPGAQPDDPMGPDAAGTPGDAAAVLVRTDQRRALERSAFNDGITVAFTLAVVAALVAGLLALALARAVDVPARGYALSLLRTMGLTPRQARRLLLVESAPLPLAALVVGTALGVALPVLLAPALGLAAFAAGIPPVVRLDVGSVGLLAGLLLLFTAGTVLVEAAVNRRRPPAEVLRVD